MAPIALVLLLMLLEDQRPRLRFFVGFVCGICQYLVSLFWITGFSFPGFLVVVIYDAALFGASCALIPMRFTKNRGVMFRSISVGLAFSLIDSIRSRFPFGGLPIDGLAISQADSFFKNFSIIGGEPAIVFFLVVSSSVIAKMLLRTFAHNRANHNQNLMKTLFTGIIALLLIIAGSELLIATNQTNGRNYFKAVAVQGGGKTGLRAVINGDQQQVFENQVIETDNINKSISFILWPEDTVAVSGPFNQSYQYTVISGIARKYNATMLVGVTQPAPNSQFLNLAVLINPNGTIIGSYLKVHRVPFGEYVPYRSFFQHFGNVNLVPKNAIAGTKPGELISPHGKIGIMISFEVFFDNRAYADIKKGAQVLFVPTNTASYKGSQMPQEELGALKIRAVETDRFILMTSPTGYSVAVNPDGNIINISKLGIPALTYANLGLIDHLTPFDRYGDDPPIILEGLGLILIYGWIVLKKVKRI